MPFILLVHKLGKYYGSIQALSRFNLHLLKGSVHGLIGPNGAGKTTLIRLINQIYQPDQGYILFNGTKLSHTHIQHIGYMPEERGLYANMSVEEQLLYLGQLKGFSKINLHKNLNTWLLNLNLEIWRKKKSIPYPRVWLKKYNLLLQFYTNQN